MLPLLLRAAVKKAGIESLVGDMLRFAHMDRGILDAMLEGMEMLSSEEIEVYWADGFMALKEESPVIYDQIAPLYGSQIKESVVCMLKAALSFHIIGRRFNEECTALLGASGPKEAERKAKRAERFTRRGAG